MGKREINTKWAFALSNDSIHGSLAQKWNNVYCVGKAQARVL